MTSKDYLIEIIKDKVSSYEVDDFNQDYDGFSFNIGDKTIVSRTGKRTPKKLGYFTVM